jgi:hypothetical protein
LGIILCEFHGRGSVVEGCAHVVEQIRQHRFGHFHPVVFSGFCEFLLCVECFAAFVADFHSYPKVAGSRNLDEFLDAMQDPAAEREFDCAYERIPGRECICSECIAVAQVEQAKLDDVPPPFPIYEKTLTSLQQPIIDDLRHALTSAFHFKPSICTPNAVVAFFSHGAYTRPLTIAIYSITTPEIQDQIIAFIDRFLASHELNQARVRFYEAEVWLPWSETGPTVNGIRGGRRGKENLLREVYLNCGT